MDLHRDGRGFLHWLELGIIHSGEIYQLPKRIVKTDILHQQCMFVFVGIEDFMALAPHRELDRRLQGSAENGTYC